MSSNVAARFEAGSAHDFAVADRDLKFFDAGRGAATGRIPLA
jgi:hypothetical protein